MTEGDRDEETEIRKGKERKKKTIKKEVRLKGRRMEGKWKEGKWNEGRKQGNKETSKDYLSRQNIEILIAYTTICVRKTGIAYPDRHDS